MNRDPRTQGAIFAPRAPLHRHRACRQRPDDLQEVALVRRHQQTLTLSKPPPSQMGKYTFAHLVMPLASMPWSPSIPGSRDERGPSPERRIEVCPADFYAPELQTPEGAAAKRTLDRLTAGKNLTRVTGHRSYDRVVALCRIGQIALGGLLRQAGVVEGRRGSRDQAAR